MWPLQQATSSNTEPHRLSTQMSMTSVELSDIIHYITHTVSTVQWSSDVLSDWVRLADSTPTRLCSIVRPISCMHGLLGHLYLAALAAAAVQRSQAVGWKTVGQFSFVLECDSIQMYSQKCFCLCGSIPWPNVSLTRESISRHHQDYDSLQATLNKLLTYSMLSSGQLNLLPLQTEIK